jgi:hypothetical protein
MRVVWREEYESEDWEEALEVEKWGMGMEKTNRREQEDDVGEKGWGTRAQKEGPAKKNLKEDERKMCISDSASICVMVELALWTRADGSS